MKTFPLLKRVGFFGVLVAAHLPLQAAKDYGLPGEFLNYGVGARPLAMGKAYTGVADDIDSLYWNPAGLSMYRSSQITFQHSPLIVGGAYQYLAYSQPLYGIGTMGLGIVNRTSGKVDRTDISGSDIGDFTDRETAYMGAYAHRFGDKLGLGSTLKMAEHVIDSKSARGFGWDVGGLYHFNDRMRVGGMIRNLLAPTYRFSSETERFPTLLRVGGSMHFLDRHLLTSMDLEKTLGASQSPKIHLGVEGYVIEGIFLRCGLDQSEITAGLGFKWKTFQMDYAVGFQELGLSNRFSVKTFFGGYEVDMKASPRVFSPVGLKNKTVFRINTANRRRVVKWILSIRNAKGEVMKSFQGFDAPPRALEWNGRDSQDRNVDPGEYTYRMSVTDTKGRTELTPTRTLEILAPTPFEIEAK